MWLLPEKRCFDEKSQRLVSLLLRRKVLLPLRGASSNMRFSSVVLLYLARPFLKA
jgi:hypothetical protein